MSLFCHAVLFELILVPKGGVYIVVSELEIVDYVKLSRVPEHQRRLYPKNNV